MFLYNKYSKWYDAIIIRSINSNRAKLKKNDPLYQYYERHHIVPKSLSGSSEWSNLVLLTAKEHFICHLLLIKMQTNKQNEQKMISAFYKMKCNNKYFKIL